MARFPHVFRWSQHAAARRSAFDAPHRAAVVDRRVLDMRLRGRRELGTAARSGGRPTCSASTSPRRRSPGAGSHPVRAARVPPGRRHERTRRQFECVLRPLEFFITSDYRAVSSSRDMPSTWRQAERCCSWSPGRETLLIRLYTRLVRTAHTPDERSFMEGRSSLVAASTSRADRAGIPSTI